VPEVIGSYLPAVLYLAHCTLSTTQTNRSFFEQRFSLAKTSQNGLFRCGLKETRLVILWPYISAVFGIGFFTWRHPRPSHNLMSDRSPLSSHAGRPSAPQPRSAPATYAASLSAHSRRPRGGCSNGGPYRSRAELPNIFRRHPVSGEKKPLSPSRGVSVLRMGWLRLTDSQSGDKPMSGMVAFGSKATIGENQETKKYSPSQQARDMLHRLILWLVGWRSIYIGVDRWVFEKCFHSAFFKT
jgi:hypothetical protein